MKFFKKQQRQTDQPHPCPTCGNSVTDIAYVYKDGEEKSDFFQCPDCTFLFARPVFLPELDTRQMDGVENAELFNSRILKWIYVNYFIRKEVGALRREKGEGRLRLLDVGCGTGWTTPGLWGSWVRGDRAGTLPGPGGIRPGELRHRGGLRLHRKRRVRPGVRRGRAPAYHRAFCRSRRGAAEDSGIPEEGKRSAGGGAEHRLSRPPSVRDRMGLGSALALQFLHSPVDAQLAEARRIPGFRFLSDPVPPVLPRSSDAHLSASAGEVAYG